jgi:hypothetical protein
MSSSQARSVNLEEKLGLFHEHWSPRTVAQFNGHDVMVVKVKESSFGITTTTPTTSSWSSRAV